MAAPAVTLPLEPMLAKAVTQLPTSDAEANRYCYEPKWDGFRALVQWDGEQVQIGSRGSKPLTRYFPELVAALRGALPRPCLLDGEIVVRTGAAGAERLDWEALSQRIHPAESRIRTLAERTPASFVAFDLVAIGDEDLLGAPLHQRRTRLEQLLSGSAPPVHLTRTSSDTATAERWFREFEGAGLDGVIAKDLESTYQPGKRAMFKLKHQRTADVILLGYRVHKSGVGVGSLLLGLYDTAGTLQPVGGASAFPDATRQSLVTQLEPLVLRDLAGNPITGDGERSRFSAAKESSFVRLKPAVVAEVRYDQMEGSRFRHAVQFLRWRPDRDARSCTFEQLDTPAAYDLDAVLR